MELRRPPRQHAEIAKYKYTKLCDAARSTGFVNVYGVVTDYEQPKGTRGTDKVCTLTISDVSYDQPGLRVLVFAKALNELPRVRAVGDIICFHRLRINNYNGGVQGQAKLDFGETFLLFDGQLDSPAKPYQKSSQRFTWNEADEQLLQVHRKWAADNKIVVEQTEATRELKELSVDTFVDLFAKVLYVDTRGSSSPLVMYVWDGTDAPPMALPRAQVSDNSEDSMPGPFPLPPREVLVNFPKLGTALAVLPDNLDPSDMPHMPKEGTWVRLRNLKISADKGLLIGLYMGSTKIMALAPDSSVVQGREREYSKRQLPGGEVNIWQSESVPSLTFTRHDDVPLSSLREVLASPQVTYKFRCLVRVVAIWPEQIEDFCECLDEAHELLRKDYGNEGTPSQPEDDDSQVSKKRRTGQWAYRLRLTLEDPTARVHAHLVGREAERFFNGHPARDFHSQSATMDTLRRKVDDLLGYNSVTVDGEGEIAAAQLRDPPWMKCCIKTHYRDENDQFGTRLLQIFGTVLAD